MSSFCFIILPLILPVMSLPSSLLLFPLILSLLVDLRTLPRVFVSSVIRSGGHFDTYRSANAAESLLGENRTVIWLCKIALTQYQRSMYGNARVHYSWPICSTWRITVHTNVCTSYLDPLSHSFLFMMYPPQGCLYQQFALIWLILLP